MTEIEPAAITVLRLTSATTKAATLAEIADGDSRDGGTGTKFGGLCVGVLRGQGNKLDPQLPLAGLGDSGIFSHLRRDIWIEYTPRGLDTYFQTQGFRRAACWQFEVAINDVVGYAWRECGILDIDGIILRRGAVATNLKRVRL
ncbi:MAG: hypothetical protein ABFD89_00895 [Bryobacteraceae bacterium]